MSNSPQLKAQPPSNYKLIQQHPLWRLLEIVPGFITWLGLLLPIIISIFSPFLAASLIIVYTITWLFRSFKLSINIYRSFNLIKKALVTDWTKLICLNDHPEKIDYELQKFKEKIAEGCSSIEKSTIKELEILKKHIAQLKKSGEYKKSKEIIHAIVFVTYKEPYEIVRESIKSYACSNYPASNIIMVFAAEEADKENAKKISEKIQAEFGSKFKHFITTIHPKNIPGEIKGKSANATFAAKELRKYIDQQKIPHENVIVSNFDADTVAHPLYFDELTFKYLTTSDRTEMSYQPTHMFHNNIWDVPIMIRMVALSCSYWHMAESMEKEKYKSFSSRSLSFKTLVDVNYWDPAVIPEDSHQYWTAFFKYDGRHRLVSTYCPLYMDAVLADTYVKTFKNQYMQLRRWAWGVCDFPFIFLNLWNHPRISWNEKLSRTYEALESGFFWATAPILISFMGYMPGLINANFRDTVLAYNLPKVMSNILTFSSIGIILCALISLVLIPNNPKRNWFGKISLVLQWLLVPIVSIVLSAIPALDAQTRLMFGKYLDYKVTEKARK